MGNGNPHIELPNVQPFRQNQPPPVPYNELPQDEEDHQDHQDLQAPQQNPPLLPQNPPQRAQNPTLGARFEAWLTLLFGRDFDKAMRRAKRLMLFCYILDFILLCPITYDSYAKVRSKSEIRGALESMSANLKADPIMDLQIIGKKSTCPAGFEPLELSAWPGTAAGCLCESGYLSYWACEDIEREGCQKDIPPTNSIEIEEWDSSLWCGKRAVLGQDYVKKADCPTGYKECYNGGCFKGECPITKVEMNSKGGIVITKTKGELPLINIQTSSNDIPCFNKDFSAKSNSSYKLLNGEELANKGCDKYGFDDKYSTRLDSKLLVDSYTQDSFRSSTMDLPYFEKYSKGKTFVLSWRVRMKTIQNDYCLDLDQNLARNSTKAFRGAFLTDEAIKLIIFFHLLILLSFAICRYCRGKTEFRKSFGSIIDFSSWYLCFCAIKIIPWPSWFFYRLEYYPQLSIAKKYFAEYDSLGCFGEGQGGQVIQDLLWMLEKGETNYYTLFVLFLSTVLALLVIMWHSWMKRRIEDSVRAYILNLRRM